MDLEHSSTKTKKTPTKTLKSLRSHLKRVKEKKSNRKSPSNPLAIEALYSTKTGPTRGPSNPGPVTTKHFYKLPPIQNANHPGDQVSASPWILDHLGRPPGWLLAYPHSTNQKTIPGFQIQGPRLAIQGPPIWVKRRASGLYKGDGTRGETTGQGGNLVSSLPGRFPNNCSNTRGMLSGHSEDSEDTERNGLANKQKQVETHTSSEVRVVGDTMGSPIIHGTSGRIKVCVPSKRSEDNSDNSDLYQESSDESTRPLQLDRPERSHNTSPHVNNKNNSETLLKQPPRLSHPNSEEFENETLRLDKHAVFPSTSGFSETRHYYTVRRYTRRLGYSNTRTGIPGRLPQTNEEVLNQRQRASHNLVRTTHHLTKEHSNRDSLRQLISHSCPKKRRVNDIPSVLSGRTNLEESSNLQLESQLLSHTRDVQCSGRSTIQKHPSIDRMVSVKEGFSENSETEQPSTSGSLRHSSQQPTSSVCVTLPRHTISRSECTSSTLGQVGSSVHVPTNPFNFEGFESAEPIIIQDCSSYHTRDTHEALVHDTPPARDSINSDRSQTSTGGGGQASNANEYYKASRVAVIKTAYRTKFQSCQRTISLLAAPIRRSSVKDYQIKWNKFCSFLRERNIAPNNLALANVLDFFSYLFFEKNLRPNTVAHYRSALTVPLELGYKINLRDPAVSHLIKAMQIERPSTPATTPAWSLNAVLLLLDTWPNTVPLDKLLQKTAFLLYLATGWRLSELHACVRTKEYCSVTQNRCLKLRPHPSFLAKNECPQKRWDHKVIPALPLLDGSPRNLCPVSSLMEYLNRTSRLRTGSLLIHPSTRKPLSKQQLSNYVCKLINVADPSGPARVHDIRKYAASYSLAETMDVTGVVGALQWKSPQVFYKFYMCPTTPLKVPVTLPIT